MKILHIINQLAKGGAEKLLVDVLPFYQKYKHEVSVLELTSKPYPSLVAPEYKKSLIENGVPCVALSQNSLRDIRLIPKLRKVLKNSDCDVIHVHLFPALYLVSIATIGLKNKPVIVYTEHSTSNKRAKNKLFRPIEQFIYKKYDAIIAISSIINDRLIKLLGDKSKVKLILNGLDVGKFKNAPIIPIPTLIESNAYQVKSIIYLCMVARFMDPKDHITLIEALKLLPDNFELLLVGEGAKMDLAKNKINELALKDRIHFLGFRTDIPSIMKSVDINILSSNHEGMSGVALEALASGKPFLGSDVPGINDVVPDARFLFEKGNPISLSTKVLELINDKQLYQNMVKDSQEYVQRFEIKNMVEQHLSLYTDLVK